MFSSAYSAEKDHCHDILKVVNCADITRCAWLIAQLIVYIHITQDPSVL